VTDSDLQLHKHVDNKNGHFSLRDVSAVNVIFKSADPALLALSKDAPLQLVDSEHRLMSGRMMSASPSRNEVVAEFPDLDGKLLVGDKTSLKIISEIRNDAKVISLRARLESQAAYVVDKNVAQRRHVFWREAGDQLVIDAGLSAGDLVVVGPSAAVKKLLGKERARITIMNP